MLDHKTPDYLDQLQVDLQGALYRDDGNVWLAVDVLNASNGNATGLWQIAARNPKPVGGISLEPGGQFELSGAPQLTIHHAAAELDAHLEDCRVVGGPLNIHFLGLGVTPLWSVADIPAMPKSSLTSAPK